jgi:hypothetical protein
MTDLKTMTGLAFKPVADLHRETPKPRLKRKYVKTVAGFLIFGGAFFMPKFLGIHAVASYVVAGFGAFMMSQELVTKYLKVIPAAIAAFRGGKVE